MLAELYTQVALEEPWQEALAACLAGFAAERSHWRWRWRSMNSQHELDDAETISVVTKASLRRPPEGSWTACIPLVVDEDPSRLLVGLVAESDVVKCTFTLGADVETTAAAGELALSVAAAFGVVRVVGGTRQARPWGAIVVGPPELLPPSAAPPEVEVCRCGERVPLGPGWKSTASSPQSVKTLSSARASAGYGSGLRRDRDGARGAR